MCSSFKHRLRGVKLICSDSHKQLYELYVYSQRAVCKRNVVTTPKYTGSALKKRLKVTDAVRTLQRCV